MLTDRWGKPSLTKSWEIITWLWRSSGCRQCLEVYTGRINIREDPARQPVRAVCTPSFKAKCPPHNYSFSFSYSCFLFLLSLFHSFTSYNFFLYLSVCVPTALFFCIYVSFAAHTEAHTHQQSNLPLCEERVVKPPVHQAGKPAEPASLPSQYLLIKEPLNSQKLQRVQERSMPSNTISKHHFFICWIPLPIPDIFTHKHSHAYCVCAYKCGKYIHKHTEIPLLIFSCAHTYTKQDELWFHLWVTVHAGICHWSLSCSIKVSEET